MSITAPMERDLAALGIGPAAGYNQVVGNLFQSSDAGPVVTLDWATMILQKGDPTTLLMEVERRIRAAPTLGLLITFRDVNQLSSQTLGILVRIHKRVAMAGGELRLAELSGPVREAFRVTHLDQMLTIHSSAAEAMAAFHARRGGQG